MASEQKFQAAAELIKKSEHILIAGHIKPDGDSVGSALALSHSININTGKKPLFYSADPVPDSIAFLPGAKYAADKVGWYPDLIIGVDYSTFDRLNLPGEIEQGAQIITFDHHPYRPRQGQKGDIIIVEETYSSTAELVYEFLSAVNWEINYNAALCIATGILTDTGSLSHNTSERTFKIIGRLLQKGVDIKAIYAKTFAGKDSKILNLWGEILESMQINKELNFTAAYIPFQKFKKNGIILDDLTGLVSVLNASADTAFSVLAAEYESGKIKGSLRSDKFKDADVSVIAEELGGGGHKYASGFYIEGTPEEAKKKIENAIKATITRRRGGVAIVD